MSKIVTLTRYNPKKCFRCHATLGKGDKIVINTITKGRISGQRTKTVHYHIQCYTDAKGKPIYDV